MKKTLLITTTIIIALLTSCTTKQPSEPPLKKDHAVPAELATKLTTEIKAQHIDFTIKDQFMTADNHLVFTIDQNVYFSQNAKIIIAPEKYKDLTATLRAIRTVAKMSLKNSKKRARELSVSKNNKFKVKLAN